MSALLALTTMLPSVALGAGPFEADLLVDVLPNGLTVVVEEQHRTGDVAVQVQYKVGSKDELSGQRGGAHLFEHLMFEGSEHVPQDMFDTWLTAAGGENNAWTSSDATAYHLRAPTGALDLALFLESDRMGFLASALDWRNLENQQDVVLQERAEGYAEPHGADYDLLQSMVYGEGHPYHVPVIGTVAGVRGFSKERARAFWGQHYAPENAVLVIVGHVDAELALERARHWFSDVPARQGPAERGEPAQALPAVRDGLHIDAVPDWTVYLAWPAPPTFHEDEAALELLSYVLSYGRGTRLDDAVYYDRRLATYSNAWLDAGELQSMFVLMSSLPKPKSRKAERLMLKAVRSVVEEPPADWELERAKLAIKGGILDELESPASRAEWWAHCWSLTGEPGCLDEVWARYDRVDGDDLVDVAQRYLIDQDRVSLSVVPEGYGGGLPGARRVELP